MAFISATPLIVTCSTLTPTICSRSTTVTMGCRRDLKKEKAIRNLEFARLHRKRISRRVSRRAVAEATQNEDNEYLSSIYGTLRFGGPKEEEGGDNRDKRDNRDNRDNRDRKSSSK